MSLYEHYDHLLNSYKNQQRWDEAASVCINASEALPEKRYQYLRQAAQFYASDNNFGKSAKYYEEVAKYHIYSKNTIEAGILYHFASKNYTLAKKYSKACDSLRFAIEFHNPQTSDISILKKEFAELLILTSNFYEAASVLEKISKKDNPKILLELFLCYLLTKNSEETQEILSNYETEYPTFLQSKEYSYCVDILCSVILKHKENIIDTQKNHGISDAAKFALKSIENIL